MSMRYPLVRQAKHEPSVEPYLLARKRRKPHHGARERASEGESVSEERADEGRHRH